MNSVKNTTIMQLTHCAECGLGFYVPDNFIDDRRATGKEFFCPNGHQLWFKPIPEETIESLKIKLQDAKNEIDKLKTEKLELVHKLEQMETKLP